MVLQDGPPAGGFKPIPVKRSLPVRGPGSAVIMASVLGVMGFGWYLMGKSNRRQREVKKEIRACRLAVAPYLSVEDDIRESSILYCNRRIEAEVMKDQPEYQPGYEHVYKGGRYVPPMVKIL